MELIKLIIDFFSTNNTITQEIPINAIITKNECIKNIKKKTSNQSIILLKNISDEKIKEIMDMYKYYHKKIGLIKVIILEKKN